MAVALLACIPNLFAVVAAPVGAQYVGVQYNTDDHMVYAAWAWQAMSGAFFFDNRFTVDPQPGLTVHLYYFLIGQVARLTGIPLALAISRFVFSALFAWLLYRFIRRILPDGHGAKLTLVLTVFGGGIGYFVWHAFGQAVVRPAPEALKSMMLGRLPTDVWQPEGFVFPSMLTSSLFMVSLCLILIVFMAFLDAREGWKPVIGGFLALGLLMNIHSYDVLLIALTMVGFLAMTIGQRQFTWPWLARATVIVAGVIPAALWFMHVHRSDPVFQARAATETFSPNFRQVLFGYLGLVAMGLAGLAHIRAGHWTGRVVTAATGVLLTLGFVLSAGHADGYWMSPAVWIGVFALVVAVLALAAGQNPALNLVAAWALVGLVALYFPGLFQRKLAMGLSIPWGILAGVAAASLLQRIPERGMRNLVSVLVVAAFCGSSLQWTRRQMMDYINENVSNTTMHPVYLSADVSRILAYLNREGERPARVLAMPGVWNPSDAPDDFGSPLMPDLNPFLSGLAGAYTYAGHWSETPDYEARRGRLTRFFLPQTTDEERSALIQEAKANYVLAPSHEAFSGGVANLSHLGEVVVEGSQFSLIRLPR